MNFLMVLQRTHTFLLTAFKLMQYLPHNLKQKLFHTMFNVEKNKEEKRARGNESTSLTPKHKKGT